jgi:hypothetical protein
MSARRDPDPPPPLTPAGDPSAHPIDPLVTVEVQREHDLFSGQTAERVFVKLYVAARESGLLAAISDRDWKTLCTLATYMDGDGYCHPSQAELAKAMGCSRQMANERVKSLAAFRFQGRPVLLVVKGARAESGEWARNGYRVLPISRLRIYDGPPPEQSDSGNDTASATPPTVSSCLDTVGAMPSTVSSPTVTVQLDTNKNQYEQDFDLSNFERSNARFMSRTRVDSPPTGTDNDRDQPRGAHLAPGAATRPIRRRVGNIEERELIAAFLRDWVAELGDEAPLASSVSRALRIFKAAQMPQARWPDLLYDARALVREHSAQIRKQPTAANQSFAAKNRMPYFLAVLEDLVGLRPAADER